MNEEQKRWSYQYSSNFGAKEFLRLSCALIIWVFVLIIISVLFALAGYSSNLMSWIFSTILVISILFLPVIALRTISGYVLLRRILGNENLPNEPYPRSIIKVSREPRPWWAYLPTIWWILIDLLLLAAVLKWLSK